MPNQPRKHGAPEPLASPRVQLSEAEAEAIKARNKDSRVTVKSLRNLQHWQPGTSGNPTGKAKSLNDIMRLARSHAPEAIEKLLSIMRNGKASHRDQIQAAIALLDRGCGKPITPVYKGGTNMPTEYHLGDGGGADGEFTALIAAAGQGPRDAYRKTLVEELAKLDLEEKQAKARSRAEVDAARAAMANGQAVSPAMRMLVEVRDSKE
jgi:hypothetical protein